jgi:REP element-mobilizing transposase RayT
MPKPRKRLISLSDTPYYHCISRCVRRAFLCGKDPLSGYSFEHRRQWIVDRMRLLSTVFAIDLCAYAVMSNHYHVVIRVDADTAGHWDGREVAKRWLRLFSGPPFIQDWLSGSKLSPGERLLADHLIRKWQKRLADVSWFMRCLNEPIARMANREDGCTGRFWEGRFKSQALLNEKAVLACMAYVDLNPIRAAIAKTPETSDYTSIQSRIRQPEDHHLTPFADEQDKKESARLPYGIKDYLALVDWAGRSVRAGKKGVIPSNAPPILDRLALQKTELLNYLSHSENEPLRALGTAVQLKAMAESVGMKFLHGMSWGKRMFACQV